MIRFLLVILAVAAVQASEIPAQTLATSAGSSLPTSRFQRDTDSSYRGDESEDPRRASQDFDRFGSGFKEGNDPFRNRLLDPRIGADFEPLDAEIGRIYKIGGGIAEQDDATSLQTRNQPARAAERMSRRRLGADWKSRAQYINRLDPSLRRSVDKADLYNSAGLLQRIRTSLRSLTGGSVGATWKDGVLVLQGSAESEYRKRMIERFVLLEPGVKRVQNEILVLSDSLKGNQ